MVDIPGNTESDGWSGMKHIFNIPKQKEKLEKSKRIYKEIRFIGRSSYDFHRRMRSSYWIRGKLLVIYQLSAGVRCLIKWNFLVSCKMTIPVLDVRSSIPRMLVEKRKETKPQWRAWRESPARERNHAVLLFPCCAILSLLYPHFDKSLISASRIVVEPVVQLHCWLSVSFITFRKR